MLRSFRQSALGRFAAPILACIVFFLTGLALLPYPGLQNDELFFSGPIYASDAAFYRLELGNWKIPFMVMSYSGALKTWIYAALFQFLAADQWSVRLPVLLMGMGTIWLTWSLVKRLAGPRAAAITAALLCTDTIFLMTDLFDWGPVAIQHLLLMGGLLAAHLWLESRATKYLVVAAACWGLGLWDKALLIWPLLGLGVASFFLYPRELLRSLRPRTVGLALASFLLAATPLVWYNLARPGETATQNTHLSAAEMKGKPTVLQHTVDGSSLFNYMISPENSEFRRKPRGVIERASVKLFELAGNHRTNWMLAGWCLALILLPALWGTGRLRQVGFWVIAAGIAWLQMALTKNAGGAAHHTILLWPFPPMILGMILAGAADRIPRFGPMILQLLVAVLCLQNLLTTNQYLARFILDGPGGGWTDAIYRLAETADHKSASWYGLVDWGYLNGLRLVHEGDLPVFIVQVPEAGHTMTEPERVELRRELGSPEFLFIRHTADKEMFHGINERLRNAAAELGFVEVPERIVPDRNGRPVFELFRFRKEGT